MVPSTGFEPVTSSLPMTRSTAGAMAAYVSWTRHKSITKLLYSKSLLIMPKKTINKNKNLSSALRENLKLRKTQINKRDKNNILGKRLSKVGYSSLLHEKVNNE